MYINSLGMRGVPAQTIQNTGGRTGVVGQENYDTVMRKALEKRNAALGSVPGKGTW